MERYIDKGRERSIKRRSFFFFVLFTLFLFYLFFIFNGLSVWVRASGRSLHNYRRTKYWITLSSMIINCSLFFCNHYFSFFTNVLFILIFLIFWYEVSFTSNKFLRVIFSTLYLLLRHILLFFYFFSFCTVLRCTSDLCSYY